MTDPGAHATTDPGAQESAVAVPSAAGEPSPSTVTPTGGSVPPRDTRRARGSLLGNLERFGLPLIFAVLVVTFSLLEPSTFATKANWQTIASSQSVLAVAALALLVPLVGGRFDVSVGAILGLSAIAAASLMSKYGLPLIPAILITLVIGAVIGIINGAIVAYLGVNSIITTLGTGTIMGGLVVAYTGGTPISNRISPMLSNLSGYTVFGIPDLFLIMLALSIVIWFVLTQTPFGRKLFAVGSNMRAAVLTGVKVNRVVMISFVVSGVIASAAGVLQVGATGSGDPSIVGIAFIVPSLAAVFLGATTWHPGTYNVPGTLIGLYFLSMTVSGLVLLGVAPWVADVFNGAAVVIAIIFSAQLRRRRTGAQEVGT
jgi:ribose transport system permease protein